MPRPALPIAIHDRLQNGLQVTTIELPYLHTVSVVMFVRTGSRYENAKDNGLSHFVEHMLFRGTAPMPTALALNRAIEEVGGTLYAETGRNHALYQLSLHPDNLQRGLSLFADIFATPMFEDMDTERGIIEEEMLEDFDDKGRNINGLDLALAQQFGNHPLGQSIIGTPANVKRFSVADIRRNFRRFYGARNMLLCLSGQVSHKKIRTQLQKFAALPSGEAQRATAAPRQLPGGTMTLHPSSQSQSEVTLALRGVPETSSDYAAQLMLQRVLDDGMSTRLYQRLCDESGLAYQTSASIDPLFDVSVLEFEVTSAHTKLPQALDKLFALLRELRDHGPTSAELDKAQSRYRWDLDSLADDADAMAGWLGGSGLYYAPRSYRDKMERVLAVTTEDVRRMAEKIFRKERLSMAIIGKVNRQSEKTLARVRENCL